MSDSNSGLNILFLGGGSIGAIYAFLLSRSPRGHTITVAVRSAYPIVSTVGYSISSVLLGEHTYLPSRVISSPSQLAPSEAFDYIFITTKATSGPLPLHGYPLSASTTIVLIQNGIGIEEPYVAAFPGVPIVSGVAYIAAAQPSPGRIVQSTVSMSLQVGVYPARGGAGEEDLGALVGTLNAAGIACVALQDLQGARWRKLLFNACYATVCAVTGLDTHEAMAVSGALITGLAEEVRLAANAAGTVMKREEVDRFFNKTEGLKMVPSMLQDRIAGREMEVRALCGNVVAIAREFGVVVPKMEAVWEALKGINRLLELERAGKAAGTGSTL
ncbi:6-phosphogluconate dehydrogenase [Tricharina praecox]|uniref:6-phosphogluconate dehydrogenase n=1 Tax=Tricharina praecox TaxID=43433 RepID=UPI00221F1C60|nr:6-phosphogluconate dehydrogenase [Tricharina praecox]XP_051337654.1 6-phosphogluconate dehydrogenase [Tricharina praecox]KAI5843653.1 6-phosphogluconate dehydrogenase [Tricharina praecox]KAI5848209.1 6-phosphogluconate dehydrogenase [Tricharina praecox]